MVAIGTRVFCRRIAVLVALCGWSCSDSPQPESPQVVAQAPDLASELESILGKSSDKSSTELVVTEVLEAGRYTYAKIKDGQNDRWVAAPQVDLSVGDRVIVGNAALMENFTSPSLKRTFDQIHFANEIKLVGGNPKVVSEKKEAEARSTIVVEAAADGLSIEKLMAAPGKYVTQTATVRGRVVKFNAQIMGRNWIHIQDGSGSPEAGNHDLTITTKATVKVGQTIEAVGKLVQNKDFGAGYNYPVLMEDAAIEVLQ